MGNYEKAGKVNIYLGEKMKNLYIIGAGGCGREIAWLVERINNVEATWNLKGFIDDNESCWGTKEEGYTVLGGCEYLINIAKKHTVYAVCAIGSSLVRKKVIEKFKGSNVKFATLIDPSVIISDRVKIGSGTTICAGNIITVDIQIGNHVIINFDCTLTHDDIIEDFVTLYPSVNVSGNVVIGNLVELGTGTQIIQGKRICSNSIVGAGAVIIKDIEEPGTYVGCPAKKVL